jgi:serine/threonine protein kinase
MVAAIGGPYMSDAAPGHLEYNAPETLPLHGARVEYTAAVDIYSFGVLLVELATGQEPSCDRRPEQIEAAVTACPALRDVITACTQNEVGTPKACLRDRTRRRRTLMRTLRSRTPARLRRSSRPTWQQLLLPHRTAAPRCRMYSVPSGLLRV